MASRQGGSFNSFLGRRKSLLASLSSEQQRAGGSNLRGEKYIIINVSKLTFLVLGRPTAPECLCLSGTLFCVGERPPSSFLLYFICQIIAAATLSHSNRTPPQLNRAWVVGRGGAMPWLIPPLASERSLVDLRSASLCFQLRDQVWVLFKPQHLINWLWRNAV